MARPREFMREDLLTVLKEHEEPFLTVGDITGRVNVSKSTVHDRLEELNDEGVVKRKEVGSRAVVWWLPERERAIQSREIC
jgi:predicted transcriptional regulator